jgi:hypothetical protein
MSPPRRNRRSSARAPAKVPIRTVGVTRVGAALLAATLASGCAAQRILDITSTPPGALILLDDRIVGETPYRAEFDAYGTRRITLYKTGYRTRSRLIELRPKWYARFPFDVVSEVLIPIGWRDEHPFHVTLDAESGSVTEPDLRDVLERANELRLATPDGPRPEGSREKPDESSDP